MSLKLTTPQIAAMEYLEKGGRTHDDVKWVHTATMASLWNSGFVTLELHLTGRNEVTGMSLELTELGRLALKVHPRAYRDALRDVSKARRAAKTHAEMRPKKRTPLRIVRSA